MMNKALALNEARKGCTKVGAANFRSIALLLEKIDAAACPDYLSGKKAQLFSASSKLPDFCSLLCNAYRERLREYSFYPGRMKVWVMGGRVAGTRIKQTTDIDLILCVENWEEAPKWEITSQSSGERCVRRGCLQLPKMLADGEDGFASRFIAEKIHYEFTGIVKDACRALGIAGKGRCTGRIIDFFDINGGWGGKPVKNSLLIYSERQ